MDPLIVALLAVLGFAAVWVWKHPMKPKDK